MYEEFGNIREDLDSNWTFDSGRNYKENFILFSDFSIALFEQACHEK